MMSGHVFRKAPCLEYLLCLKLVPNLKWNMYIHKIANDAGRMEVPCITSENTSVSLQESDQTKNGLLL